MLTFLPADLSHVPHLATHMRSIDKLEWECGEGHSVATLLVRTVLNKDIASYVCEEDGVPIAIFGVTPAGSIGVPWLAGTERMERYPKQLVKQGRLMLKLWSQRFQQLGNVVHANNEAAISWLQRIGFTVLTDTVVYSGPEPHHPFFLHV